MSISNEGMADEKSRTALDELLEVLEDLVDKSHQNTSAYRNVLMKMDTSNMSWEDPQPDEPDIGKSMRDSHLSTFSELVTLLKESIVRDSEILGKFNKII